MTVTRLRANLALIAGAGLLALLALACATRPMITPSAATPAPSFASFAFFRAVRVPNTPAPSPIRPMDGGGRVEGGPFSPTGGACHVAAAYLHLRSCPSPTCPILAWLPQGAPITPTGAEISGWLPTQTGYVKREYLTCP